MINIKLLHVSAPAYHQKKLFFISLFTFPWNTQNSNKY